MNERRNGRAPAHLGSSHPHFLSPSHLTSWQGCRKKLDTQDGSVRHPPPGCESSRMLGACITHPEQNKRAPALGSSSTTSSGASFPLPPLQRWVTGGDRASAGSVGETNSQLVGKREAEVSVEAARRGLWGSAAGRAGDCEQQLVWEESGCGTHQSPGSQHRPTHHSETHTHTHILSWSLPSGVYLPPCFYGAHLEDGSIVLGRSREWGNCLARSVELEIHFYFSPENHGWGGSWD